MYLNKKTQATPHCSVCLFLLPFYHAFNFSHHRPQSYFAEDDGIVLTRGTDSVWYAEAGTLEDYPVEPVQALNTTGSGDAFTAGLAAALADGASLKEALAEGARCGRLNALLLRPGSIR